MFFQVIPLLTLALAPLSTAAASSGHERADVAPSTDGVTVSNGSHGKAAACSVGHKKHRGKKHRGKKTKHLAEGPSTSTHVNPVPPVNEEPPEYGPGNGETGKGEPGKGEPGKGEPGNGETGKGETGKGEPPKGKPVQDGPGNGETGKGEPPKGKPVQDGPGNGEPAKGEPPKGKPVQDGPGNFEPPKDDPGNGHPVAPVADSQIFSGLGTSYQTDQGNCFEESCWRSGACSFVDYTLPQGIAGSTCVSGKIWYNGLNCGGCVSVSYKGKKIILMVTNRTDGEATHLDMTPNAMKNLVGYVAGGIGTVQWEWVRCPLDKSSPLTIKMHGGASKYWFAATVENATLRTDKVEVSTDNGQTWVPTTREAANMHVLKDPLHTDYVWVRATSVSGEQVVVKNVHVESGLAVPATTNY